MERVYAVRQTERIEIQRQVIFPKEAQPEQISWIFIWPQNLQKYVNMYIYSTYINTTG